MGTYNRCCYRSVSYTHLDVYKRQGKDHWEPILRTRAIENGCYLVAPAQIGQKPTVAAYGKTIIIDPWGNIIAKSSDREGVILAEIDLDYVEEIRSKIGTLKNRRVDIYKVEEI